MRKKWVYRILARIKGRDYLVWQYSNHFDDVEPTRKEKRLLKKHGYNTIAAFEGTKHSNTAVGWVLALQRDIQKWNAKDNLDHQIMKDGLFNPHFRTNKEDQWFNPGDVNKIYFEMSLYDVDDEKTDKIAN